MFCPFIEYFVKREKKKKIIDRKNTSSFLQYTLMKDPVILPSSRITIDRPVIQRHLLSDGVRSHGFYSYNDKDFL